VFLCRSLLAFTSNPVNSGYADSLYNSSNFQLAALEYERVFYSAQDNVLKCEALLKKSYCYKSSGDYVKGAQTLQRIGLSDLPDSTQFNVRYEHALDCFLAGNYQEADDMLMQIDFYTKEKSLINKCIYLDILNKDELQKWDEADSSFYIYLKTKNISIDSATVHDLLKKPKLLNPKTAGIISYIIPGSGQMYSGHIFRGISSMIFEGGFGVYTYYSLKNGFYLSGLLTGLSVLQMLYFGGARYAHYLAEKENAKKIELYNSKIREFILKQERNY
jgi:hypothetical protein